MMYPYYYGSGWGFFDGLWHVIGILIAVVIIVWLVRMIAWGGRRGRHSRRYTNWHAYPALEILDERFAKGEISKEEYEERKKVLMGE